MGVLRNILGGLGGIVENVFTLIILAIPALIKAAIWAVESFIDLVNDVLSWINNKLQDFISEGATEVNVIKGNALSDFVKQNQAAGKYTEISLSELNAMKNSVVNVAMDKNGNIIDDQMIRSSNGLNSESNSQFQGQPMKKIRIA